MRPLLQSLREVA
jgi:hypothetical protein